MNNAEHEYMNIPLLKFHFWRRHCQALPSNVLGKPIGGLRFSSETTCLEDVLQSKAIWCTCSSPSHPSNLFAICLSQINFVVMILTT